MNGNSKSASPCGVPIRALVRPPSTDADSAKTSPPGPNVNTSSESRRCGLSASSSSGITARPSSPRPVEDLGLRLDDRLERPEQLEVDRADVRDRGDVRLGDLAELGDLTHPAHRHLHHEQLGLGRRREDRERHPDLGVEVLRAGVDAPRQDRPADVLDRRLPGRAGDPDRGAAELAAPGAREATAAPASGSSTAKIRAPGFERSSSAPCSRPTTTAPGAGASAAAAKTPPSCVLAGQAEEEVAGADLARVDDRPLGPRAVLGLRRAAPAHRRRRRSARGAARSRAAPGDETLELLAGDVAVVEGDLPAVLELLALLVALAGDHDEVAGLRPAERQRDRGTPVGLDHGALAAVGRDALEDLLDDRLRGPPSAGCRR